MRANAENSCFDEAYIYIYIFMYISLQFINIWHYINSHYRYDIQEMKINLPKQLPFLFIW